MKRSSSRRGGFTLIELLIASTIVIIAIAMAGAAFSLQNKSLQSMDLTRVANASTRDAMLSLEGGLRTAGYGVDPRFAINLFTITNNSPAVDSATGPDELSFIARSPMYHWDDNGQNGCATSGGCFTGNAWAVSSMTTGPLVMNIVLSAGQVIEKGRLLLSVCVGGEKPVLLTSSARYATAGATAVTMVATAAFPYNDTTSIIASDCHGSAGAALFLVDKSHYYLQSFGTPAVSWLMFDSGLDLDNDGSFPPTDTDDVVPIAPNVEDFQVAYMLNGTGSGPDSNNDWIISNSPTNVVELPTAPASNAALPIYQTAAGALSRLTLASANVRAIRVSLIVRSHRPDPNPGDNFAGDVMPYPENRIGTSASGGRYRRFAAVSEITLRNLESTTSFTY